MVNQIEIIRSQLSALTTLLQTSADSAPVKSAADDLDKKLIGVEENLIQRKLTGTGQDATRWPAMLVAKMAYLAGGVSNSDFPPTTQARAVHAQFKDQLAGYRRRLDEIVNKDLEAFNRTLRERNIQNVIGKVP
jgi:hypothetical protein